MEKKIIFVITIVLSVSLMFPQIRDIRDNTGYFWDKTQFLRLVEYLKKTNDKGKFDKTLIGGICPHDDYLYAAKVYWKLFNKISPKEVIIIGVTHHAPRTMLNKDGFLVFDNYEYWRGMDGNIKISELRKKIIASLNKKYYIINNKAHSLEHSIESMIPFLQYRNKNVKITPIMVTGMDLKRMGIISKDLSKIIVKYIKKKSYVLGKDIFILISADANHYGKDFNNYMFGHGKTGYTKAIDFEEKTINENLTEVITVKKISNLTGSIWGDDYRKNGKLLWCGKYSIPFGVITILNIVEELKYNKDIHGKLFLHSDSYKEGVIPLKDTGYGITAPFSYEHWVSYFSIGFYLN